MRTAFVLGIPLAFLAAGCTYDNGDANRALYNDSVPPSCYTPAESTIDTDALLQIDAGIGAGIFVEYASGGHYHVRTSCDTTRSNYTCSWNVILSPEAGKTITNVVAENLEGEDSVQSYPPPVDQAGASPSYQLIAETSTELDGVTFDIEPGAAVSIDAFLDHTCALPFFFWEGDGAVHQGSPSNPLLLTPTLE